MADNLRYTEEGRKQTFIAKTNQQIRVYTHLIEGLDMCIPYIKEVNARLTNRITEGWNPHKLIFSINGTCLKLNDLNHRWYESTHYQSNGYLEHCWHEVELSLGDDNRLNAEETIRNIDKAKEYLKECIQECQTSIEQYDEELEAWQELKKQVDEYQKKFSYRLRGQISMKRD